MKNVLIHVYLKYVKISNLIVWRKIVISFTMYWGAQQNRLKETVLLSTNNICFGKEIRQLLFNFALYLEVCFHDDISSADLPG